MCDSGLNKSTMTAITEYTLIGNDDEGEEVAEAGMDGWKAYPGDRRAPLAGGPPEDVIFLRTGGNALQAVNRSVVEHHPQLISVVVPEGKDPGDEILVTCPFVKDRLISVTIPKNATAGSVFLVEPPSSVAPIQIVTGIPVNDSYGGSHTPIVTGLDIDELALHEEATVPGSTTPSHNQDPPPLRLANDPDDEEYEMVQREGIV